MELKEKVICLPHLSGVYIFKDKENNILYIGKAKDLKKRVSSYFIYNPDSKTQALISKVKDLDYIITPSVSQAQILEASLIKKHLPPYNISLKDDKSFPYICITDEEYPRVYICRLRKKKAGNKSLYFGPYTNAKLLRQAFKIIRKIFGFRSCQKMSKKACFYGKLSLCPACCEKKISVSTYKEIINNIILFLNAQYPQLLDKITQKMQKYAQAKRFEEAAILRDQIQALSLLIYPSTNTQEDQLKDLKDMLGLKKVPRRIEAFDISNFSGKQACGAMVSFYMGKPDKNNYRRFRIKTVTQIDDYAMLKEVIRRRYLRLIQEKKTLPDLIIVDGGKAHLNVAKKELEGLNLEIPIIAIAKGQETVYAADNLYPLNYIAGRKGFDFILKIRDEAHRFAIFYHRKLRKKQVFQE